VTLAAPEPSSFADGPYATLTTGAPDDQRLSEAFAAHDVAVIQTLPSPRQLVMAIRHCRHIVVDLIAPLAFEAAEAPARGHDERDAVARWRIRQLVDHLAAADLVLCTNARQLDLFLGAAMAAGGGVPAPERFAVVPHGIDEQPPRATSRPLREAGLVGESDRLAMWAGGFWGWLDPLTPIRAVELLRERRPDVRLALVGIGRGSGPDADLAGEALAYVHDRGLHGDAVLLVHEWLDRDAYVDHLLEADAGVSAHPDTLESRYGTRTRILDYLWAGLPVACTSGDAMADFVESRRLGATAAPGDVAGFAAALDEVLSPDARSTWDGRALEPLLWPNAARPLVEYCREPHALPPRGRRRAAAGALRHYSAFVRSIYRTTGAHGVARAAARRARR
jgi:glycosyltransferase involved in cell wall biosynthesis